VAPGCSETEVGETATATAEVGAVSVAVATVNVTKLDCAPELVLSMLIAAVPERAMSALKIVAVAWFPLITFVGRWAPFHSKTHLPVKFDPYTVRLKLGLPATAPAGES
jgi:hypothetical protein